MSNVLNTRLEALNEAVKAKRELQQIEARSAMQVVNDRAGDVNDFIKTISSSFGKFKFLGVKTLDGEVLMDSRKYR
jgi:hypothetical protein